MSALEPTKNIVRPADEGIYLNENRYREPKEVFKRIADVLRAHIGNGGGRSILDVGCATGEFLYYLQSQFPDATLFGMDVSNSMIEAARAQVPKCDFKVGSVLKAEDFATGSMDVLTCSGVLSIFDDQAVPLNNLVRCLRPGGHLVIVTLVNNEPVDVIMRYRDVRDGEPAWEAGWNFFSKKTFENILAKMNCKLQWNWTDFRMPFALPKQEDPMRTLTISTAVDPHQVVNGAGQLIDDKILYIHKAA